MWNVILKINVQCSLLFKILTKIMDALKIEGIEKYFIMEKDRYESFKSWPFDENSICNKRKMAEAGFYWSGTETENDSAECFVCGKVLDGWESTDDPWKEHKKHAPQCIFVKTGKSEINLTVDELLDIFGEACVHRMKSDFSKKKKKMEKLISKIQEKIRSSCEK